MSTHAERPAKPDDSGKPALGDLLRSAQRGDQRALEAIVERLMPLLWNVARAQGLDSDTAMDVVQTTWLTLLERLNEIHTPRALASWLVTVTRREAWRVRTQNRRNDQVEPHAFVGWPDPAGDIESSVVDDEQNHALWQNLRLLSPRCQELLRIAAFADRPDYAAIAEALGMARGSIGPTRGRCLAKLRVMLANDPVWSAP